MRHFHSLPKSLYLKAFFDRSTVRGILRTGFATGLKLTATGLTLVFGIVGARMLGAETFGAYVSLFTIAGLLTVATSVGLPSLLQREVASSRGSGDRGPLKPLVQGLLLINGVLLLALAGAFALNAISIAFILLYCVAGNVAGVLGALFVAHERVLIASWVGNVLRPLVALLTLVMLSMLTTPTALLPLYAQVFGVMAACIAFLLVWRGEPLSNAFKALTAAWWSDEHAPIVRSGIIFASTQLLINLTTQVDILILMVMANSTDVAHYYAAVRAALVINLFFGASSMLAEPKMTRLHASGNVVEVQNLALSTALTGAIVTIGAAFVAIMIAPHYLRLFGADFIVALPSFIVFTAGLVMHSLFGPAQAMLRATRSEVGILNITAVVLILNVVLTVVLIPFLGIVGAAIGSGVQFAVYGWLLSKALWKQQGIRSEVLFAFQRRSES